MEANELVKPVVSTRGTGWKPFLGTESLPPAAIKYATDNDIFRSRYGSWIIGAVFYRGDINTTKEWIIVTDDGGYYKVFAKFSMWHQSVNGVPVMQCLWSVKSLKKSLRSLMLTGETVFDPQYQT